jgi:hypothetical protein
MLLHFAVEGACRLMQQRDFTIPSSSRELLKEWMLHADTVRAWAAARLEVTDDQNVIAVVTTPTELGGSGRVRYARRSNPAGHAPAQISVRRLT